MSVHSTGLAKLDQALGGGIPDHGVVVIGFEPPQDPAPLLRQFVRAHLTQGGEVLVVGSPATTQRLMSGWPGPDDEARAFQERVRRIEPAGIGSLAAARGRPAPLILNPDPTLPAADWDRLRQAAAAAPFVVGVAAPSDAARRAQQAPHALVLSLGSHQDGLRALTYFTFQPRGPDARRPGVRFYYAPAANGGIALHLPKVLVTGPHDAGKTEFIRAVSTQATSIETLGTTVSLDHGRAERDGLLIDVFGTPGQERFGPIIQRLAQGAVGIVLVVDATRPETLPRAREILAATRLPGVPLVVAANRHGEPHALGADGIRAQLDLGPDVPVVACAANRREPAQRVLDTLVDLFFGAATARPR